jgi:ubiquinone/menaquinone biosynthesis C-methylase UbiE
MSWSDWKEKVKERYNLEYDYDSKRREWISGIPFRMELGEILKNIKNGSVLEIGVGTGRLIPFIRKNNFIGVDISKKLLIIAKEKMRKINYKSDYELICADADHLPLKEKTFDNIIVSRSIKFFPDLEKTLLEIRKIMSSHGRLIITSDYSKDSPFYKILVPYIYRKISTEKHFSLDEITKIAEKAGFNIISNKSLMILGPTLYKHAPQIAFKFLVKLDEAFKTLKKGWFFIIVLEPT